MEMITYIAGITFENRQEYIKNLKVGDKLKIVRDPSNQFDCNAIRLLDAKNNQLGFIPKEIAEKLAPEIDMGRCYNIIICSIKPIDYDEHLGVEILVEEDMRPQIDEDYDNSCYSYASEFPDMEAYESWYESSDF